MGGGGVEIGGGRGGDDVCCAVDRGIGPVSVGGSFWR